MSKVNPNFFSSETYTSKSVSKELSFAELAEDNGKISFCLVLCCHLLTIGREVSDERSV